MPGSCCRSLLLLLAACLLPWPAMGDDKPPVFVHPGMLQSRADLDFMKRKVAAAEEPWKSAWEFLLRQSESSLEFKPQPFARVIRGPYGNPNVGGNELAISARAAHSHALQWVVTGNRAHAAKVIEILAAWSPVLTSFHENDAKLLAGWTGHAFGNAAEIIRWTDAGWQEKDIAAFQRMLLQVYYPLIADFFPEANGNWDAAIIDTMLCIGIFCDDRAIFDRAVNQYLRGPVNAGITHYVYPSGQCQESTRDQAHVQLGLGEYAQACQVAWTQGVDLFGTADNRLALGFEYTARFLAGEEVPAQGGLFPRRPGRLSPIYEEVCQHYRFVKGLEMPWTERALEKTRARSWTALVSYKGPATDGSSPRPAGPPRPSEIAAAAGALREPSAQPRAGAIVVNPGESVQRALDTHRGQGDWVVLANGLHRLPAPLKIPSGVTLAGQGFNSILWLDPKLTGPAIVSPRQGLVNVTIRDLVIEGATASSLPSDPNTDRRRRSRPDAPSRAGIEFVSANPLGGTTNLRLERVVVRNCTATGVSVRWASEVVVHDCDFSDNGSSAPPGPGAHHNLALAYAVKGEITGNVLSTSPSGSGVELTQCSQFIIAGNETTRNRQCGIRVVDCGDIKLERNLAEGNNHGGIITDAVKQGCWRIEVLTNRARNNGGYGIDIRGTRDTILRDNTAVDNGRPE